jgi:nucleotide-binding universal stress UspA family protein
MYHKILVPLDGSELAEKILPHVSALAQSKGAEIVLLRVPVYAYESQRAMAGPFHRPSLILPDEREEVLRECTTYLNRIKRDLSQYKVNTSIALREGEAAESIVEYARRENVDLIAMSTHGRTGLNRAVFGSVAERVLRHAGKPVLLIRPEQ